ncbi:MAG: hypothetical protein RLZZ444_1084, partial [Pseudomonadota bacterium]
LFDTPIDDLPSFNGETIRRIKESLAAFGISTDKDAPAPRARPKGGAFDLEERINVAALANLASWVPALGLYGCEPKRNGYRALADWTISGTGKPDHERELNLSITHGGIKDFGDAGRGYTPIGLVMAAEGVSKKQAMAWLMRHVDFEPLPPWDPIVGEPEIAPQMDSLADVERESSSFMQRFVDDVIPAQKAREARFQELVGHSIPGAFERLTRVYEATNARRAELERKDADLLQRERELEAMFDEAELRGFGTNTIYAEQFDINPDEVTAKVREFWRYWLLAQEFGKDGAAVADELRGAEAEAEEIASFYLCQIAEQAPGTGKTTTHINITLSRDDIRIATMSPTNRLGWELEARSSARAWAGLGAEGPDGTPLCIRREEGRKIEAAGGSRRKLCEGCPHRAGCPAWDMIDSWTTARHVAGTHNHLAIDLPQEMTVTSDPLAGEREFDAVVIDESPVKALRPGHQRLEIGDLGGCLAFQNMVRQSDPGGIRQSDVQRLDKDELKEWMKRIQAEIYARADMSVEELTEASPVGKLRLLVAMINAVLYDEPRGERRGDLIKVDGGLLFSPHVQFERWVQGKAVMLMSATPEPDNVLSDVLAYKRWVPKLVKGELKHISVICRPRFERMRQFNLPAGKNVRVVRYLNIDMSTGGLGLLRTGAECSNVESLEALGLDPKTFRNRRAELERRQGLVAWLRKESVDGRKVVVVATSKIRGWLAKQDLLVDLLEWGKAIGSNAYEDHDALVVLGDQTEPKLARLCRACDFAGEWQEKLDADPVSDHRRFAETWQAVERLRSRRDKDRPVTVHIWSDVPLPIDNEAVDGRAALNNAILDQELAAHETDGKTGGDPAPKVSIMIGAGSPPLPDCIATSSPGIMKYHGLSKRKAEQRAKEPLPPGYTEVEAIIRAEDGSRTGATWAKFAVREDVEPIAAIQGLTGRRVDKVRPRS